MTDPAEHQHRAILQQIARRAMLDKGLVPEFPPEALSELEAMRNPATSTTPATRDLRQLLWCSIDNDDSRDLDQLTVAEALPGGAVKIQVAIADVDALVKPRSALDGHARENTTSVYTVAAIFPMLPDRLSTDLTSLNYAADRLALVIEMIFTVEASLQSSDVCTALVRNRARLSYNRLAAWLDGNAPVPAAVQAVAGLDENIKLQNRVARQLQEQRRQDGSLDFESIEARPVFAGDEIKELVTEKRNCAKDLIANFMIAANGVTARFLAARKLPSLRRIVRTPKRWERIVELAAAHGTALPRDPDSKALEAFLAAARAADPLRFPDLSLAVIKLMGPGEYGVERPGETATGHFGLAVKDYSHSTAPNRRYPDLVTQRLLRAALAGAEPPYPADELDTIARRCTEQESAAKKVERQVKKSAIAILLENRIGEQFDALVTGAADKGTWVRLLQPPIEGRLASGFQGVDVGDRLRVELIRTDVERGYIDFKRVPAP